MSDKKLCANCGHEFEPSPEDTAASDKPSYCSGACKWHAETRQLWFGEFTKSLAQWCKGCEVYQVIRGMKQLPAQTFCYHDFDDSIEKVCETVDAMKKYLHERYKATPDFTGDPQDRFRVYVSVNGQQKGVIATFISSEINLSMFCNQESLGNE